MELSLMTFSMMEDEAVRRTTAETICAMAQNLGISSIDIMEHEVSLLGKEKLLAALSAHGIRVGSLIVSPPFYSQPRNVSAAIHNSLELAKELGTKVLMVVPGSSMPGERRAVASMGRENALKLAIHHFRDAVSQAGAYGIRVGFENTPQDFKPLSSAADVAKVLELTPGLGLIFDTGNFRVADKNCDEREILEVLKERIIRVHVKDVVIGDFKHGEACVGGQSIRAVMTGVGIIPLDDLLSRLRAFGYDGDLCIEYARPKDLHGADQQELIGLYADTIRAMWEGGRQKAPSATFPGIDMPVSRIFFGTAIPPMIMGKRVFTLLDAAFSAGINAIDTARGYGLAEKSLGEWVKERNIRDRVVILSKCGNAGPKGEVHIDRKVMETELAKSLAALQTDYIDIYLLHRDDPDTPVGEYIEVMNEFQRAGKIRVFGASNWTRARIEEANAYAEAHGLSGFSVTSPNFGLAVQITDPWGGGCVTVSGPENEADRAWYAEKQMPVLAYSSLGRGFFSGRFRSFDTEGAKKVLDRAAQKGYLCDQNMRRLAVAERLAERDADTVPGIAMRYIFSGPMKVFALVSSTSPSRMRDNITAALRPLSEEDVRALEEA